MKENTIRRSLNLIGLIHCYSRCWLQYYLIANKLISADSSFGNFTSSIIISTQMYLINE